MGPLGAQSVRSGCNFKRGIDAGGAHSYATLRVVMLRCAHCWVTRGRAHIAVPSYTINPPRTPTASTTPLCSLSSDGHTRAAIVARGVQTSHAATLLLAEINSERAAPEALPPLSLPPRSCAPMKPWEYLPVPAWCRFAILARCRVPPCLQRAPRRRRHVVCGCLPRALPARPPDACVA